MVIGGAFSDGPIPPLRFSCHGDVISLLAGFLSDQEAMTQIRATLAQLAPEARISSLSDHRVIDRFAQEVQSGAVTLRRGQADPAPASGGGAAAKRPEQPAPPLTSRRPDAKAESAGAGGPTAKSDKLPGGATVKRTRKYTMVAKGKKRIYTPKKPNGKTLYFFFGFKPHEKDQKMLAQEAPDVEDDVKRSAKKGFKVFYYKAATKQDFLNALYDPRASGLYWSGHGYMNGDVSSSNSERISPSSVDKAKVSPQLKYLILAACGTGLGAAKWKAVLPPKAQFEGWKDVTTSSETNDFTDDALIGDGWKSHKGMNPEKELDDYIEDAE